MATIYRLEEFGPTPNSRGETVGHFATHAEAMAESARRGLARPCIHRVQPIEVEGVTSVSMKQHDISTEAWREYQYANGDTFRIEGPERLFVADSGGHRVVDENGVTHCPRQPWVGIRWHAPGQPVSF